MKKKDKKIIIAHFVFQRKAEGAAKENKFVVQVRQNVTVLYTSYTGHPFPEASSSVWPFLIIVDQPYSIFFVSKHKFVILLLLPWGSTAGVGVCAQMLSWISIFLNVYHESKCLLGWNQLMKQNYSFVFFTGLILWTHSFWMRWFTLLILWWLKLFWECLWHCGKAHSNAFTKMVLL